LINRFEANVFTLARKDLSKIAARKHLGMTIMRDCKGVPFAGIEEGSGGERATPFSLPFPGERGCVPLSPDPSLPAKGTPLQSLLFFVIILQLSCFGGLWI